MADVKVERVTYLNQPNCIRLSNGTVEVVITTAIGPRVIRYAFIGGDNILGEVPDLTTKTALGDWKPWGGHRLWIGPEGMPLSYSPDNDPVAGRAHRRQHRPPRAGRRAEDLHPEGDDGHPGADRHRGHDRPSPGQQEPVARGHRAAGR